MKAIKLLATGAFLLASVGLIAPTIASAGQDCDSKYHSDKHERFNHKGHFGRMDKVLDLTDAQQETLKIQREANKARHKTLRTKIQDTRSALNNAVEAGANEAELSTQAEALGKLHAEQALATARDHQAFLALLTPEQKEKLAELKAKRIERMKERKAAVEAKTN